MNNQVKVVQPADKEKHLSSKVLAEAIVSISKGTKALLSQGLNERAVLVLLHDTTGINKTDISKVLKGLQALETNYVKR